MDIAQYVMEKSIIKFWLGFKTIVKHLIRKRKNNEKMLHMKNFRYQSAAFNAFKKFTIFNQKNKL
jgi:hypothetical protein